MFIPGVHAVREGVVAGFNIAHCDVTVTSTQRDLLTDLGFQPQAYAVGEVMLTVIGEKTGLIGLIALGFNASDTYPGHEFLDSFEPLALRVASAMEQVGLFTPKGLQAASDIWGSLEYKDQEDHHDGEKLTERLLRRLLSENLMLETAQQSDAETLYRDWQIPMYNLDFSLIPVSLDDLEAAQEREYWSMVGDPR